MKNLNAIIILLSVLILASCSSGPTDYSKMQKMSAQECNDQFVKSVGDDMKEKKESLTLEQKIEICLVEFSQVNPEKAKELSDRKYISVRTTLIGDKDFNDICARMGLDPNEIPLDYFPSAEE